jgi:hypothetical protein
MANPPRAADDFQTIHAELERIQREESDALSGKNTSAASSPPPPPRPRAADDFTTIRKKVGVEERSGPRRVGCVVCDGSLRNSSAQKGSSRPTSLAAMLTAPKVG